jgi:hypothetical protein
MSHRIVVMCEGRITGELSAAEATQERIMTYATQRGSIVASDGAPNGSNGPAPSHPSSNGSAGGTVSGSTTGSTVGQA